MTARVRIAVAGAGSIGRRHIEAIAIVDGLKLAAIVDPANAARDFAETLPARWFPTLDDLLAAGGLDGVILALPNQIHAKAAMACVAAGLPTLVEKPLTRTVAEGEALVLAAKSASVPLLVGGQAVDIRIFDRRAAPCRSWHLARADHAGVAEIAKRFQVVGPLDRVFWNGGPLFLDQAVAGGVQHRLILLHRIDNRAPILWPAK